MQDAKAFRAERSSWRILIQLNLVRSIRVILDAIARSYYPSTRSPTKDPNSSSTSPSTSPPSHDVPLPAEHYLDPELLELRLRLNPLLQVEEKLARRFMVPELDSQEKARQGAREVAVNSTVAWKDVFSKLVPRRHSSEDCDNIDWDDPTDPGRVLHECAHDMKRLWKHPIVQELLERQNLRLEEMAGFFLDEIDEVTSERYEPTNTHILKARLKTLGVSEHRIRLNAVGGGLGRDWRIYDVGGHRSLLLGCLISTMWTRSYFWLPFPLLTRF
ncbi:hypothetical protein PM082_012052 [Marasmius tenuissimus]|nr:hypothetical protein PM082_012052 [Marasmius tenuissimus]